MRERLWAGRMVEETQECQRNLRTHVQRMSLERLPWQEWFWKTGHSTFKKMCTTISLVSKRVMTQTLNRQKIGKKKKTYHNMHPFVCHSREIYKWDSQHNILNSKRTWYFYSIHIRLFAQMLMLRVSIFL
jgi:hypothetical protein